MFETILDTVVTIVAILAVAFILFNHSVTKKYLKKEWEKWNEKK